MPGILRRRKPSARRNRRGASATRRTRLLRRGQARHTRRSNWTARGHQDGCGHKRISMVGLRPSGTGGNPGRRSNERGRTRRAASADGFRGKDQWKDSDAALCGPTAAQTHAARTCGRPTRTTQGTLVLRVPTRRGAPPSRREGSLPARASLPAVRTSGCRPAGSPQRRRRVWRQPPPAHRVPARAPSTPTAFRRENAEWCPRHAGGRLLQRLPPCRCQNGDDADTPDSSRRSAESAARSEDNSMPHLLAP